MKALSFKRYIMPIFAFFIMFAGAKAVETVSTWQWNTDLGCSTWDLQYSKTDKYIVAKGGQNFFFLDPATGEKTNYIATRFFDAADEGELYYGNIAFINQDTEFLLESEDRKTINCYGANDFKLHYSLEAPEGVVLTFDVSRDEKKVVGKIGKKGLCIWDLESKKIIANYTLPTIKNELNAWIERPRFEPNGEKIMAAVYCRHQNGVTLVNYYAVSFNLKLDSVATYKFPVEVTGLEHESCWSKSGNYFATLNSKNITDSTYVTVIHVFSTDNYKELFTFEAGQIGGLGGMFFSNDEEHIVIAFGSQVDICKVFRIKDGKNTINYHPGNSSDGACLSNSGKEIILSTTFVTKYSFSPTSSVESNYFDNGVISYPNPIKGGGVLKFNQQKPGTTKIFISDEKGTVIKEISNSYFEAGQQAVVIDASDLTDGAYFITVVNDTQNFTNKIIVQR